MHCVPGNTDLQLFLCIYTLNPVGQQMWNYKTKLQYYFYIFSCIYLFWTSLFLHLTLSDFTDLSFQPEALYLFL